MCGSPPVPATRGDALPFPGLNTDYPEIWRQRGQVPDPPLGGNHLERSASRPGYWRRRAVVVLVILLVAGAISLAITHSSSPGPAKAAGAGNAPSG